MADCVRLGFTGTHEGMTPEQYATVEKLVAELQPAIARHGACEGADAQFSEIVFQAGVPVIVAHLGHDRHGKSPFRAKSYRCTPGDELPSERYMKRNRAIVAKSNLMIATPRSKPFPSSGGTLLTTRAANASKTPVTVVWPDGSHEVDFSLDA